MYGKLIKSFKLKYKEIKNISYREIPCIHIINNQVLSDAHGLKKIKKSLAYVTRSWSNHGFPNKYSDTVFQPARYNKQIQCTYTVFGVYINTRYIYGVRRLYQ